MSGVSSSPNGSTYCAGVRRQLTPNQWYGYVVLNTNSGGFSTIISNTANTIYFIGSTPATVGLVACTLLTFNTGDHFQIRQVYAALDQPGRGSGNLLQDQGLVNGVLLTINTALGIASWPNESLEGIYCWANTLNGAHSEESSLYPGIQVGRDIYNDTPRPGYTPLVYPHPLASSNTNNNILLPPSHLRFNGSGS